MSRGLTEVGRTTLSTRYPMDLHDILNSKGKDKLTTGTYCLCFLPVDEVN